MRRRILAAILALALLAGLGGAVASATPTDPCESSYTAPMNSTAKLKAYMDCRFDRLDAARPTVTVTATAPASTPTATASATPTGLSLEKEPWTGGAAYYDEFSKAKASGWTDPDFFPIAVFLGKPEHASSLWSIGVNTYMGAEHDGSSDIAGQSINPGALTAALPAITAALLGASINPGLLAATLPTITGLTPGTSRNPGTLTATLPRLTGCASTLVIVTPAGRTVRIPWENRTVRIPWDDRTLRVRP